MVMEAIPGRRRRNSAETKARILTAAEDAFSERGYASVGIRDIAKSAGVASSLLLRYFGSKAALFEETLVHSLQKRGFPSDKANFGETMSRLILNVSDFKLTAMIVLAAGDPEAREITRRVAEQHMIGALARWLGPPNARARAMAMLSVMTGAALYRRPLHAQPAPRELARWLSRTLQDLVGEADFAELDQDVSKAARKRS